MTTNVQPGSLARETLYGPAAPPANVGVSVRETLYQLPPPPLLTAAVCRETLISGFAVVRVCVFM